MKRLLIIPLLLLASSAYGAYWVSPTGEATWENCSSETPLAGAAACLLSVANTNVAAGDTVYLRGGTYVISSTNRISPAANGTLANRITYQPYTASTWAAREVVILQGSPPTTTDQIGAYLVNDYALVKGIKFEDCFQAVLVVGGNYNEIGPDNEVYHTGLTLHGASKQPGMYLHTTSTNNWVHDNKIHDMGFSGCDEGHDGIKVGHSSDALSSNNTIEDNEIYSMGHSAMDIFGQYTVIRNNAMHNAGWKTDPTGCDVGPDPAGSDPGDGKFGHRNLSLTRDSVTNDGFMLVEGNRIGHASANPVNAGPDGISLGAASNILRYNYIFGGDGLGIYWKSYGSPWLPDSNLVYNNTIYYNGRYTGTEVLAADVEKYGLGYLEVGAGSDTRNNIINSNVGGDAVCFGGSCVYSGSTWANNLCDATDSDVGCTDGSPTFTNTSMSDMTSLVLPDLSLQSGSTGIDGGTYLTRANGSGSSSTTLIVDNALYFQAGSAAATNPMGATISSIAADWIAIGTVGNIVQISDINYSTNTITLASAKSWADDASIWLYKDSNGTIVLYGAAPDQGANEYNPGTISGISCEGCSF